MATTSSNSSADRELQVRVGVHCNTDLIFLPAIKATGHTVYFGEAGSAAPLARIATLLRPLYIVQLPGDASAAVAAATAVVDTDYVCCVDTVTAGGEVYTEMVWRFTVRGKNCCAQSPCTHRRVQA